MHAVACDRVLSKGVFLVMKTTKQLLNVFLLFITIFSN